MAQEQDYKVRDYLRDILTDLEFEDAILVVGRATSEEDYEATAYSLCDLDAEQQAHLLRVVADDMDDVLPVLLCEQAGSVM